MESGDASLLPHQFGPLQGIRIISSGTIIAQPFAAALAAEMGAEVVQVERPGRGDLVWRNIEFPITGANGHTVAAGWVQDRRNSFHVSLDISKPKGREVFLDLLRQADIWMESSIPGTYPEWGLDDATVHEANPRLVIAHVSGYGQDGHPDYLTRASYDFIGQGFGGLMNLTGFPEPDSPVRAAPWTGDYITALFCMWSALAGYIHAQRTGKGQVIDLAQYEAIHRILAGTMVAYYELGLNRERSGNAGGIIQPYDTYQAADGWVNIAALGGPFERLCEVLGLDVSDPKWHSATMNPETPEWYELDAIMRGWVEERTVQEVMDTLNSAQVGCSTIMTPRDMAHDPHYEARNVHIEWKDIGLDKTVKGTGVFPKFSDTPGQVWRGSVPLGHDNNLVLQSLLGLSESEVSELREQGVI